MSELCRLVASDDEYTLFAVVVFKRVHDEFVQKCRDNKLVVLFTLADKCSDIY